MSKSVLVVELFLFVPLCFPQPLFILPLRYNYLYSLYLSLLGLSPLAGSPIYIRKRLTFAVFHPCDSYGSTVLSFSLALMEVEKVIHE